MTRWMKCVSKCWMKRAAFAILAALILWPSATSAHDVPDNVSVVAFLKPENGRMLILVRMPANALIDFIFPTLFDSNWLDLKNINGLPEDGAKVWIADLLSIYEDNTALPTPKVIAARLSRAGDSSFNTFQDAFSLVNGDTLPTDSLLTQDTATVDALLETPIRSVNSHFSFEPRFERVGVRVITTLSFLPPNGGIRQFQYEGDPETFELNPSWNYAVARFFRAGFAHYLSESDYLLFLLCVALVFRRLRVLALFSVAFATAQSFALVSSLKLIGSLNMIGSFQLMWSPQWAPVICGVMIAAATVYMGIEAIAAEAGGGKSPGLAICTGLIFGSGYWFGLQPLIQFGGIHPLASTLGFDAGILTAEICALALLAAAVQGLLRSSNSPRAIIIIAAAIAVHISWHRMLDRARSFALVPLNLPAISSTTFILAGIAAAALAAVSFFLRRRDHPEIAATRI